MHSLISIFFTNVGCFVALAEHVGKDIAQRSIIAAEKMAVLGCLKPKGSTSVGNLAM
ncbi:MAG: hypothetical protein SWZ49_23965 [Cyanobacteriota bacterium]|nr:hypothetical protein [Cyanobacteriota bacterium]